MCIDLLDPQNAKKNKNAFSNLLNLPPKLGLVWSEARPPLSSSDSWHQEFEFGLRMDIFGPLEPEIWLFEVFFNIPGLVRKKKNCYYYFDFLLFLLLLHL